MFGRFHAFYLAEQLQKYGVLNQLITTYPTFKCKEFGVDPQRVKSLLHIEVLHRLWQKLGSRFKGQLNLQFFWFEWFDQEVAKSLKPEFDIFVGWSGSCFHCFQKAKELGAITILVRGSSHIAYQTRILEEEYERWGLKFTDTHPKVYEREIFAYQNCDYIAVPSLFARQTFLDQGIPDSKILQDTRGVNLEDFYPVSKEDKKFRVIHCGGISLRKGVQYLLQAFYELNLPDAELWLVGSVSPEMSPFLDKYQSDKIILKGHQPQAQLQWFYSQCSVFCIASIEDGFGVVITQAMACGLPVIHTTNTGGSDVVRDRIDGFCIPIRDVEAIKRKILFFYENLDKRNEMGQNALLRAQSSFSWDDYGKELFGVYNKLLNT